MADEEVDAVRRRKQQEEEEVEDSLKFSSPNVAESSDAEYVCEVMVKQKETVYQQMMIGNRPVIQTNSNFDENATEVKEKTNQQPMQNQF